MVPVPQPGKWTDRVLLTRAIALRMEDLGPALQLGTPGPEPRTILGRVRVALMLSLLVPEPPLGACRTAAAARLRGPLERIQVVRAEMHVATMPLLLVRLIRHPRPVRMEALPRRGLGPITRQHRVRPGDPMMHPRLRLSIMVIRMMLLRLPWESQLPRLEQTRMVMLTMGDRGMMRERPVLSQLVFLLYATFCPVLLHLRVSFIVAA